MTKRKYAVAYCTQTHNLQLSSILLSFIMGLDSLFICQAHSLTNKYKIQINLTNKFMTNK